MLMNEGNDLAIADESSAGTALNDHRHRPWSAWSMGRPEFVSASLTILEDTFYFIIGVEMRGAELRPRPARSRWRRVLSGDPSCAARHAAPSSRQAAHHRDRRLG